MWASALTRRRGLLLRQIDDLSVAAFCAEVAGLQWEIVIELAQTAHHAPKESRGTALAKLARSSSVLDRYAAQLVRDWHDEDRT